MTRPDSDQPKPRPTKKPRRLRQSQPGRNADPKQFQKGHGKRGGRSGGRSGR